ncbi:UNKNOWN [Stylonychia lemnae]|uniref:Uncharacterized protein n=1 Tax=Stylonychia lemnae TaxID=5949 RepID=A0A078A960_STYLE|nr:UNKNOWN [Stylonychia lemnae]|eukprot:CDW78810.1 UNKNOWN [Stylonychia lemnae]
MNEEENVIQDQIVACLDGYVNQMTGKCVPNCGIGQYGLASYSQSGMIQKTVCLQCDQSCYECSSENKCLSCKKGFFLQKEEGKNIGQCLKKQGQFEITMHVQSKFGQSDAEKIDGSI